MQEDPHERQLNPAPKQSDALDDDEDEIDLYEALAREKSDVAAMVQALRAAEQSEEQRHHTQHTLVELLRKHLTTFALIDCNPHLFVSLVSRNAGFATIARSHHQSLLAAPAVCAAV